MRFLNNMKIGLRLNLITSLVMAVIISSLGIYTIKSQKIKIIKDTDLRMFEQVNDLSRIIEAHIEENQKRVDYAINAAREILKNNGEASYGYKTKNVSAINQISKSVQNITIHNLKIGNEDVYNNNRIVDKIQELTGATATIFQKIPDGYLRVSTNVLKENGERAVGTYIPNNSPVIQTIEKGEIYRGRAFVVNDYYVTTYEPILIKGNVQGILYVGLKEKDISSLRQIFKEKIYFESGYPFLIDKEGTFIIHPTKEGENFVNAEFFQQIIKSNQLTGKTNYSWEGKNKFQYFKYIEQIESYVSVSIYESELLGIINQIRNATVIAIILGIIIFIIINSQISKSITKALNMGVEWAEKIASGDLSTSINLHQKDEMGLLVDSLNKMAENLKNEQYKYKTLFETANDAILILNDQNVFVDCNIKTLEMLECTKEQIIGKSPKDILSDIQEGGISYEDLIADKRNLVANGIPQSFSCILRKDIFAEVSLNNFKIGKDVYVLAIVRDITKRKKTEKALKANEEKYRLLTENSPDITYIYSLNHGVLYWSSRIKDILGFNPNNLKTDKLNWNNAIHIEDRSRISSILKDIQPGKSYEMEYRIYDIHNKMHWFYDRIFNVYETNGDIIIEGLISDITDEKNAQQKILYAMINAEERERSRVAKDLHDGVSPVLSAIKLYSQSMRDTQNEKIRSELCEKIGDTINNAITSINEISNNISPHILQNFGLVAAVKSFADELVNLNNIKLKLKSDLKEKISESVEIALYRITTELINNTLKYADSKNISINYISREERVFMSYSDDGKGFNVEEVLKKQKGMGIFNMKNRIIALRGRFEINSILKKGTFVELIVPIKL